MLRTRVPTGLAAWPTILIDGPAKCGKSCAAYELSASQKVGHTFLFPFGEQTADEYAALGPYIIVEHDGGWADFYDQLVQATKEPMVDGKPNVIIIDSGTEVWALLSDWVHHRARSSRRAKAAIAADPDVEIDPTSNYWNDGKARWANMLRLLNSWSGIAIIVGRGEEVTAFQDGQPVANQSVYRVAIEKTTPFRVTANVRIPTYRSPVLVGVTKLGVTLPNGGLALPRENPIEHLVFDVLGTTVEGSATPSVAPTAGKSVEAIPAKQQVAAVFLAAGYSKDEARDPALAVWHEHYPEGVIVDVVPAGVLAEMCDAARALIDAGRAVPPADTTAPPETDPPVPVNSDDHVTDTEGDEPDGGGPVMGPDPLAGQELDETSI